MKKRSRGGRKMTNREAHEKAAGMSLDAIFFSYNNIDPDAEVIEEGTVIYDAMAKALAEEKCDEKL